MNSTSVATRATSAQLKRFGELTKQELDFWHSTVAQNEEFQRAFLTATFCRTAAIVNDKVRVMALYADGHLVGILPLRKYQGLLGWLSVFEPVAGEMTDYFGAVVTPGVAIDIDSVLRSAGVGLLVFSHLDESQNLIGLTGEDSRVGLRTVVEGVGGAAAETIGRRLKKISLSNQVLCVTHLAQIAGCADHHYSVEKRDKDSCLLKRISATTKTRGDLQGESRPAPLPASATPAPPPPPKPSPSSAPPVGRSSSCGCDLAASTSSAPGLAALLLLGLARAARARLG